LPTALRAAAVANACRMIEAGDGLPSLDALAQAAGMSRFHFHKVFKSIIDVTPRAYAAQRRTRRVRKELTCSNTVTNAIYDAGFNSNGRFCSESSKTLDMTPSNFRAGGKGELIRFALGERELGSILVAATEKGIGAISLSDDPESLVRDLQIAFPERS
jgi:AraC family transcriptional regulator of adaptative response/methylated-DNA-[protein]-cysteine methyltransferase